MSNFSSLKQILSFHEQTLGLSDDEKKIIAQNQSIDYNEYQRRILGKEKEMEFLIIMRSMESFKDIRIIDEEESQVTGKKTPDYEVEFVDGYKMMLEVKHTDNDVYKISGGNLQKRINYATAHNMPLRFAISIKGIWGLFTSDFLKSKSGKISLSDYYGEDFHCRNSWLDRELETCSYMFLKPLKIISIYSINSTNGLGVFFEPYGELISYELFFENRLIFRVDYSDASRRLHMFVMEMVQNRLSNIFQDISTSGDCTTIVEHNEESSCIFIPEYQFIMAIIRHMRYRDKNFKDNIFLMANEPDNNCLPVKYIRLVMSDLSDLGVEIICFKDGVGYAFDDYCKKFWKRISDEG